MASRTMPAERKGNAVRAVANPPGPGIHHRGKPELVAILNVFLQCQDRSAQHRLVERVRPEAPHEATLRLRPRLSLPSRGAHEWKATVRVIQVDAHHSTREPHPIGDDVVLPRASMNATRRGLGRATARISAAMPRSSDSSSLPRARAARSGGLESQSRQVGRTG